MAAYSLPTGGKERSADENITIHLGSRRSFL